MTDDEIVAAYSKGEFTLPHREFVVDAGRKIIAAYQAKLLAGVEMPEPIGHLDSATDYLAEFMSSGLREAHYKRGSYTPSTYTVPVHTQDQLQQYAAAAAAQSRVKAIEQCLIKVTGLSVDVDRCKKLQLTTQAWEEALDAAADAIEQLKVKP